MALKSLKLAVKEAAPVSKKDGPKVIVVGGESITEFNALKIKIAELEAKADELEIQLKANAVSEIMTTELMNAVNLATSTVTVNNIACNQAAYQYSHAPGLVSQDVSIYCLRGSELWKIYFSRRVGDSAAQVHVADFNGVLESMKFLP